MEVQRLTGPESGVLKYDVLTMLSVAALSGTPTLQTSVLRLIALVTARYNWRNDELTVGQRDMARMWSVNERTVKREIKRLTEAEILVCKRAGVKGRVGAYRLNYSQIARLSEETWALVGPDFESRLQSRYRQPDVKVVALKDYKAAKPVAALDGPWGRVMAHLAREAPEVTDAWFSRLTFVDCDKGRLTLTAPSRFIQRYIETHLTTVLLEAVAQEMGPIEQLILET